MIQLVLTFHAHDLRRVAVMFEDGRGEQARLKAMTGLGPPDFGRGSYGFSIPFVIITEASDEGLHRFGRPETPAQLPEKVRMRGGSGHESIVTFRA